MKAIKQFIESDLEQKYPELKKLKQPEKEVEFTPSESSKKAADYFKKIYKQPTERKITVTYSHLKDKFIENFEKQFGVIEMTKEVKSNLDTLFYYFSNDPRFFDCENLLTDFPKLQKKSIPSFKKGLLIVGYYGVGKSSAFKTFAKTFEKVPGFYFKNYSANDIVELFESIQNQSDKDNFWKKMLAERIYFDDVKTEREASNFGKANLIKEVIEKRYNKGLKDYISCNYFEGKKGDVEAAILEFATKYGGRVYDRIFEKYNIIEFKGDSFRC